MNLCFGARLILWSVIIIILLVLCWQNEVVSHERVCTFKGGLFCVCFLRIEEKVLVAFASNTSECSSQLLIDGLESKLHRVLWESERGRGRATWTAVDRRDELTPCPPDGIHYEEIENSPASFFSGFFFPSCEDYCRIATCLQHPAVMDIKTVGFLRTVVLLNKIRKERLSKDLSLC